MFFRHLEKKEPLAYLFKPAKVLRILQMEVELLWGIHRQKWGTNNDSTQAKDCGLSETGPRHWKKNVKERAQHFRDSLATTSMDPEFSKKKIASPLRIFDREKAQRVRLFFLGSNLWRHSVKKLLACVKPWGLFNSTTRTPIGPFIYLCTLPLSSQLGVGLYQARDVLEAKWPSRKHHLLQNNLDSNCKKQSPKPSRKLPNYEQGNLAIVQDLGTDKLASTFIMRKHKRTTSWWIMTMPNLQYYWREPPEDWPSLEIGLHCRVGRTTTFSWSTKGPEHPKGDWNCLGDQEPHGTWGRRREDELVNNPAKTNLCGTHESPFKGVLRSKQVTKTRKGLISPIQVMSRWSRRSSNHR